MRRISGKRLCPARRPAYGAIYRENLPVEIFRVERPLGRLLRNFYKIVRGTDGRHN